MHVLQVSGYSTCSQASAPQSSTSTGNFAFLSPFRIPVSLAGSVDAGGGVNQDSSSRSLNQVSNQVEGETGPSNIAFSPHHVSFYENNPASASSNESSMPLLLNVFGETNDPLPGVSSTQPRVDNLASSAVSSDSHTALTRLPALSPICRPVRVLPNVVPVQNTNAIPPLIPMYVNQQPMLTMPNVLYQGP